MISEAVGDELLVGLPAAFRFAEARAVGVPESRLRRWLADGSVDRFEVASRSPAATICLVSGLVEHDLVDDNPPVLDVAVPRGAWRPQVAAAVRWHTFAVDTFDLDRDIVAVDSTTSIGLYGAKRCIVDVFRLRHEVGPEVGVEALRRWLRRRGNHPGHLLDLAQHFPAALPSLTRTLQVLL
jgi:hypothetical protein